MYHTTHYHIYPGDEINAKQAGIDRDLVWVEFDGNGNRVTLFMSPEKVRELRDRITDYLIDRAVRTADPTGGVAAATAVGNDPRD